MSLTKDDQQAIRNIFQEGIAHLPTIETVRQIVKDETAHLPTTKAVRQIVRDETAQLATKEFVHQEVNRLEGIVEAVEDKVDTALGMLSDNLKVKTNVTDHARRLKDLEIDGKLIKTTLTDHSKQINSLTN